MNSATYRHLISLSKEENVPLVRVNHFLMWLKANVKAKKFTALKIKNFSDHPKIPWESQEKHQFVVHIKAEGFNKSLYKQVNKESFGQGSSVAQVRGVAHAAAEGVERLFAAGRGFADLRPTSNTYYSIMKDRWEDVNKINVLESRSGEAFHLDETLCLQAALAELIERHVISELFSKPPKTLDITASLKSKFNNVKKASDHLESNGYKLSMFHIKNSLGAIVIFAIATAINSEQLPIYSFKGNAAGWNLDFVVQRSLEELGRFTIYGRLPKCRSQSEVISYYEELSPDSPSKESVAFAQFSIAPTITALRAGSASLNINELDVISKGASPEKTLLSMADAGQDLLVAPLFRSESDNLYCYKLGSHQFIENSNILRNIII